MAAWTSFAAARNWRSTKLWDLIQRRNFSFSPRFFSPRRLIWIKSVITDLRIQSKWMSDRLYLSCWVRGFSDSNLLRHFGKMLDVFPFSKLAKTGPVVRVYAISYVEPPVFERVFDPGALVADMIASARDFVQPDCCVEIEAAWDLWQHHDDWKLWPSAVTLSCYGAEFEHKTASTTRRQSAHRFRVGFQVSAVGGHRRVAADSAIESAEPAVPGRARSKKRCRWNGGCCGRRAEPISLRSWKRRWRGSARVKEQRGASAPRVAPSAAPASTSLRKCIPRTTREAAILIAQKSKPGIARDKIRPASRHREGRDGVARGERELIGRQQVRPAVWFERTGAFPPKGRFSSRNRATPAATARVAASRA